MSQKTLANQASKALFAVKSKLSRFGGVNLSVLFKIFDSKILPILLYGSEIWFSHASPDIEKVHNQFCMSSVFQFMFQMYSFVANWVDTKLKFSRNSELLNIGLEFRHFQKTDFLSYATKCRLGG